MDAGRLAVVSGASAGIGAATAQTLLREGWTVVMLARRREKLESVAAEVDDAPGRAVIEPVDAADGPAVQAMAERVLDQHGAPDAIVNSAGAGQWKFIEDMAPGEVLGMTSAPYFAAFEVSRAFMGAMLERRRGVIVHVGSPVAAIPWPGATGYAGARWALRGLHEALCQDLRGTGVRSCLVVFGKVTSEYFQANPDSEEHIPGVASLIPVISSERAARVIVQTLARPRRLVAFPFMLRFFYWTNALVPGLVRWLAWRSGRRR